MAWFLDHGPRKLCRLCGILSANACGRSFHLDFLSIYNVSLADTARTIYESVPDQFLTPLVWQRLLEQALEREDVEDFLLCVKKGKVVARPERILRKPAFCTPYNLLLLISAYDNLTDDRHPLANAFREKRRALLAAAQG